jgi:hypothetical protein
LVGDGPQKSRFPASRARLAAGSTMFRDMFALTEKPELGEGKRLEELPVPDVKSADDFGYFLAMLQAPQSVLPHRTLPKKIKNFNFKKSNFFTNFLAQNIVALLALADRFDAKQVTRECDRCLANLLEMDLMERLLLAERYGLQWTVVRFCN